MTEPSEKNCPPDSIRHHHEDPPIRVRAAPFMEFAGRIDARLEQLVARWAVSVSSRSRGPADR